MSERVVLKVNRLSFFIRILIFVALKNTIKNRPIYGIPAFYWLFLLLGCIVLTLFMRAR